MKLSAIASLLLGAGIVQVAAVPIRVILVSTSIQEGSGPLDHARFGHPVNPDVAHMMSNDSGNRRIRRPCKGHMGPIRQKSIEMSNAFRKALGWPLIEPHHPHHQHHGEHFKSLDAGRPNFDGPHPHGHPHPHHFHSHEMSGAMKPHGDSFSNRVLFSLSNLGRWEGRAVAFVLGCGIGVLLRMVFVLFIVAYRAVRGSREDEHEYSHVVMFEAADVVDAPPSYVDEKNAIQGPEKSADSVKPCHR